MLALLPFLVWTAATGHATGASATTVTVSDGAPEMLRAMIGAPHLSRKSTKSRVVPEAMMDLYAAQAETKAPKSILRGATTVRSFTHKDRDDITRPPHSDAHKLLWFNITDIPESEMLRTAHIELNRVPHGAHQIYVNVHDVLRRSPPVTRLIDTRTVSSKGSDKITLDVEPAVRRWLADPSTNHGVVIELSAKNTTAAANHVRLRRSAGDAASWLKHQPVLLAYIEDPPPRKKRSPRRKHARRHCRRHSMYVDFAAVGWDDWIVAPSGYEAYYCQGDCSYPIADHLNATNHAIVQTLQNSADPRAVPKPCCVPTTLGPISMLYTDSDDKTVLKVYHDMVVLGCGCR